MIQLLSLCIILVLGILMLRGIFRPGIMLALMWATYAIEQVLQQSIPIFLSRSWLINVALTLFTGAAVARAFLSHQYRGFVFSAAHLWMVALYLLTALSYFWSISPEFAGVKLEKYAPYIVAFAFVAPFCAFNQKQIQSAIDVTNYFGGLILVALAFGSFGRRGAVLETVQGQDIEANPLAAATFGGYVVICSVFSLYSDRSRNAIVFAIRIGIALLGIYTIIRSGSRGQLIGVMIACFLWLPITARMAAKRSTILAYIFAIVLAGSAVFLIDYLELAGRWSQDLVEQHSSGRFQQASHCIQKMWEAGPTAWLFGLGTSACYELIGGYPHMVPGEVLAEMGIVGFFFYLAFMISVTIGGFTFMMKKDIKPRTRVQIGLLLTLFTFEFGLGLKQNSFLGSTGVFNVGLCVVVCTQLIQKKATGIGHLFSKRTMMMPNPNFQGSPLYGAGDPYRAHNPRRE